MYVFFVSSATLPLHTFRAKNVDARGLEEMSGTEESQEVKKRSAGLSVASRGKQNMASNKELPKSLVLSKKTTETSEEDMSEEETSAIAKKARIEGNSYIF